MNQVCAVESSDTTAAADARRADLQARFRAGGACELGEQYIAGAWSADNLTDTLETLFASTDHGHHKFYPPFLLNLAREVFLNPQRGSGVFVVGERHYDLGNDLFEKMLDSSMTYTSGIWADAQTLNQAQEAKLARIARIVGLRQGMRVLDIGCGWGNFADYAARNFGATVVGLTISKEQAEYARARCSGLPVEIRLQDYRTVREQFDAVVSIEMIEAVGRRNLGHYFATIHRCLRPGGRAAVQAISADSMSLTSHVILDQYILWLLRHIFPNGYLPQLSSLTSLPERKGLQLTELCEFGADYEKTLLAWLSNFQSAWPELARTDPMHYDDSFYRMWEYYLCGCAALFRLRLVTVYQLGYRRV